MVATGSRQDVFDAFEFENDCIFNDNIDPIGAIELNSFVFDSNGTCRRKSIRRK